MTALKHNENCYMFNRGSAVLSKAHWDNKVLMNTPPREGLFRCTACYHEVPLDDLMDNRVTTHPRMCFRCRYYIYLKKRAVLQESCYRCHNKLIMGISERRIRSYSPLRLSSHLRARLVALDLYTGHEKICCSTKCATKIFNKDI